MAKWVKEKKNNITGIILRPVWNSTTGLFIFQSSKRNKNYKEKENRHLQ
jgi:hypothetical protein